jgi:hypothetical protein
MKKVSYFVSVVAVILFSITAYAQQFKKSETQASLEKTKQDLFVNNSQQHIVVSYPFLQDDKGGVFVSAFDNKLNQLYSAEVKSFSKENYIGSIYSGNDLFLFGKTRDGEIICTSVDDKTGAENGTQTSLFSLQNSNNDETFLSGSSADSSHFYLFCRYAVKGEKGLGLQGVVLDKQMKVIASFQYITPEKRSDVKEVDAVLTSGGNLNIVYNAVQGKNTEPYIPLKYTVVKIAQKSVRATPLIGLPDGDIRNINWLDQNGTLTFTALLSRKKKTGFTAVLSGQYDLQQNKVTNLKETELSQLLSREAASSVYLKNISETGLPSSVAKDISFICRDGSTIIAYQISSMSNYQSYYAQLSPTLGGSAIPKPSFHITYNFTSDVFILKLDANKQPLWLKVIRKEQRQADVTLYLGACYAVDDQSGIHVLFYDSEENNRVDPDASVVEINTGSVKTRSLTCVSINKDGQMKKRFLYRGNESEFCLSPERSKSLINNELTYIALKTRNNALSVRQLVTNAQYRIGTITIHP